MQGDVFGLVGATLEGRYRLDSMVGEGGFGVVYRGQHLSLQHPIAVKCLKTPPHFSPQAREAFIARFRDEGQMLSRLRDCPGVVHVYDYGVTGTRLGTPAPYLVLEWLDGQTLESFLAQRRAHGQGLLSLHEAVALLAPAIDALAFAHRMKIAHRDIKPANIFLANTARGLAVKVLDFGIAKAMQEGDSAQQAATGTGSSFQAFSPLYGAPEQFFSRRYGASGPWTDVHALALVLVEALTGRPALDGEEMAELLTSATAAQRPTPRARGLWAPEPVEAVFQQALALSTAARYPDAEHLYEALRQALHASGLPVPGPLPSLAPAYGYGPAGPVQPTPQHTQSPALAPAAVGVWRQPAETYGVPQHAASPHAPTALPPGGAAGTEVPVYGNTGYGGYSHGGYTPGATPGPSPAAQPYPPGGTALPYPPGGTEQPYPPGGTALPYPPGGTALPYPPGGTALPYPPGGTALPPTAAPGGTALPGAGGTALAGHGGTEIPGAGRPWEGPSARAATTGRPAGRGPLVAGALAVLLLGGAVLAGAGALWMHQREAPTSPSAAARPVQAGEQTEVARNVAFGREAYGLGVLPDGRASGRWVHVITRRDGRTVSVQKRRPNGSVAEEIRYERGADGRVTEVKTNGHQVEVSRTVREPDGTATTTQRTGEVLDRGCSRVRLTYSAHGDITEQLCLSPTGLPITDDDGCQLWRYTHDEAHRRLTSACFLVDDAGRSPRPTETKEGHHLTRQQRDEAGFLTQERYFDLNGAPVARLSDGCFGSRLTHDAAGNQTDVTCLDVTATPRPWRNQQIATLHTEFDAQGCPTRQAYLDVAGGPAKKGEIAFFQVQTTPQCDIVRASLHGPAGALVQDHAQGEHAAVISYELDARGDQLAARCQDSRQQPVNCQGAPGAAGSMIRWQRDERGRPTRQQGFFLDGRPSAVYPGSYPHDQRFVHGDDGRVASQTFFDEQGNPATALGQVSRIASRYDAMGGLVSETFYGTSGRPVDSLIGCHEVRYSHDARHRIESVECRSSTGALKAHQGWINRGVTWPVGAARMVVERGEALFNVYSDPGGRVIKRVECKKLEQLCYR